jgi:hypothetical protein
MSDDLQKKTDVVILHSPTEDGEGMNVLRARDERLEVGQMRPVKDGKPITGELVSLAPRQDSERAFDVTVLAKVEPAAGPAQVATRAYRDGWERIFAVENEPASKTLN